MKDFGPEKEAIENAKEQAQAHGDQLQFESGESADPQKRHGSNTNVGCYIQ